MLQNYNVSGSLKFDIFTEPNFFHNIFGKVKTKMPKSKNPKIPKTEQYHMKNRLEQISPYRFLPNYFYMHKNQKNVSLNFAKSCEHDIY